MKTKETQRKDAKKYRERHSNLIDFHCKFCHKSIKIKAYLKGKYIARGGVSCDDCQSLISSRTLKALRASQSPEESSTHAKFAQSLMDHSAAVTKQWENIKNDPQRFEKLKEQRSDQGKKNWSSFDEEKKNRIIVTLLQSKDNVRSKISDEFKSMLLEKGIHGFESEQPFHGFIPDEINHALKIIVEVFGDLYHCNPEKYKDSNQYVEAIGRTVGEQWKRDKIKIAAFARNGYKTIIVWEKDFRNNPAKVMERVAGIINEVENEIVKREQTPPVP